MGISTSVIQKLNSALGSSGRPHRILYDGQWIDTGCMEWSPAPSIPEALSSISPELQDALRRSQEFLKREYTNEPAARLAEFFAREPTQIQAEYAAYTAKLERAALSFGEISTTPKISPALQNATARIQVRLKGEQFEAGGAFDIDRYATRMQELFQAEPPEIQAEYAAYVARARELDAQARQAAREKELAFMLIRTLLQNDPVIAFRVERDTIVVAPTTDQFDILWYERTDGINYGLQTADIIEKLKVLDGEYGIDIIGAGSAGVEFRLRRIPSGRAAQELGAWLLEFCPDLGESPTSFPEGEVALWWD